MTVSYQYDVASSSSGGFTRLLFKWKGSVYKLVYRELLWFSVAFTALSIMYRYLLTQNQRRDFEHLVVYFDTFLTNYPLSFVVGMYVTLVVTRWWQQFLAIPWPDKLYEKMVHQSNNVLAHIPMSFIIGFYVLFVAVRFWEQYSAIPWPNQIAHCIALYVSGSDEQDRILRRTLVRYLNLSLILVLRSVSMAVKKRFPTLQHLVEGGFMTKSELEIYQSVPSSEFNTYWIPCTWFTSLVKEARKNKLIPDSQGLKLIMEEFIDYRSKCGLLWSYDWVSIPLVYTQVVTLATYSFFALCVIGRQYVESEDPIVNRTKVDLYVPIFTLLQFFFFMGLLKVAEALINPFGDDDEDFELNWIIDRHLKVSYLVVDSLCYKTPPLMKDQYFDDADPLLAYTKAAMMYKKKTFRGSVASAQVPEDEQKMVLPEITEEEEGSEFSSTFSINKQSNSFLNLLTWTATHQPQGPAANPPHGEHRVRRSMSVNDEALQIEISRAATRGGRHPPNPKPKMTDIFSGVFNRNAPSTPGTRGSFSQTLDVSSESLAPSAIGDAVNLGAVTSEEDIYRKGASSKPHPRPRYDSGASVASGSLTIHPTLPTTTTSSTDITVAGSRDDIELAYPRKSKSFDLGVVRSESTVSASAVDRIRIPENRSRSFAPRLRDIKRRRKLKVQQKRQQQQKMAEEYPKAHGRSCSQPVLSTEHARQRRWYTWLDVCGNSHDDDDTPGERMYEIVATPPRQRFRTPLSTATASAQLGHFTTPNAETRSTPEMVADQEPGNSDLQSNTTTTTSVCISMPSLHLEHTDGQISEDEHSSSGCEVDVHKEKDPDDDFRYEPSQSRASTVSPWANWQDSAENGSLEELHVQVSHEEYHREQYITTTPIPIGRRKRIKVKPQHVI